MKILTGFSIILLTLLLCPFTSAQQSTAAETDLIRFTEELLTNTAAATGARDAAVKLLTSSEEEAERDWKRIVAARDKTAREYARAERYAVLAKARISILNSAQTIDSGAYKDYEESVQKSASAKASLDELETQQDAAKKKLEAARLELDKALKDRDSWTAASEERRTKLAKLFKAWADSKTEDNFKSLTGYLTMMAGAVGETSDVELVTKKNNQANPGALIKYESELDRKNKVQPIKSANCSTGCTEKGLSKGWYYMWSERDQKETSDKNRYVHIKGPKDAVEIIEN